VSVDRHRIVEECEEFAEEESGVGVRRGVHAGGEESEYGCGAAARPERQAEGYLY